MDKRSWCYSFKSITWNTDNVFAEIQTYKDGLPILCLLSKTMSFMQAIENFLNGTRSSPHFCEKPRFHANKNQHTRGLCTSCLERMCWHDVTWRSRKQTWVANNTRILSRFDIFATRIRNEFTSHGRNHQQYTFAIYYLAHSSRRLAVSQFTCFFSEPSE